MIKIHKQLWYIIALDREDDLAYMTYYEDNESFTKRKSTGEHWAKGRETKWNPETRKYEIIEKRTATQNIIDNSPVKGIYIGSSVSRWSTSNKLFRVKDPRGFTVEVPTDNIATLLHLTTVVNGIVQEECVWGREGNNHILLPVNSEPYLDTLDKMDILANRLIKVSELKVGDVVIFFGNEQEYTFLGKGKPTWKIKPYTRDRSWNKVHTNCLSETEYKHDKFLNIFSYTYKNWEGDVSIQYTTENNPKIVSVLKNISIDRSVLPNLSCPSRVNDYWYDSEVIDVKWKE